MQLLSYATHRHRSNRAAVQPSELFHEPGQIEASLRCTVLLRAQLFLFLNSLNSSYSVWRNLVDHQQTIETLEVNGSWVSPHCWWGNDRCWCYENPWCFVGKDTVGRAILPPLLGHPVLLTWRPMKLHPSDQWWSVYWKRGKPYIYIYIDFAVSDTPRYLKNVLKLCLQPVFHSDFFLNTLMRHADSMFSRCWDKSPLPRYGKSPQVGREVAQESLVAMHQTAWPAEPQEKNVERVVGYSAYILYIYIYEYAHLWYTWEPLDHDVYFVGAWQHLHRELH